jgi:UDP-N-acetylglucosamine 1-carboxyvinyltransferase
MDLSKSPYFHTLRYSILLLYPLLARFGAVTLPLPGGCKLDRALDCHLKPLALMGYDITETPKSITVRPPRKPRGFSYQLDPRRDDVVGFTESAIMAAMLTDEPITLIHAATEPEVMLLLQFLKKMGLQVRVDAIREGESDVCVIRMQYTEKTYRLPIGQTNIRDRIETGSWMGLLAATPKRSRLTLTEVPTGDIHSTVKTFQDMGLAIDIPFLTTLHISNLEGLFLPMRIVADNHPGFPTDLQPIATTALCWATGTSQVEDHVFPNRWGYVRELQRARAQIETHPQRGCTTITGHFLQPATMACLDLRGAWAVLMAGASMTQPSTLTRADQLFRGYEDPLVKLRSVGLDVRITDEILARDLSQHPVYHDIIWLP